MAKKICIPYNGKKYSLEFTRSTVSAMEKIGFSINELGDKPATMIPCCSAALLRQITQHQGCYHQQDLRRSE